jgi:hypothetical protein
MNLLIALIASLILVGCQSGVTPISQRGLEGANKGDMFRLSRKIGDDEKSAPLYTKQDVVVIEEADEGKDTGSLYLVDDNRNQLYLDSPLVQPGRFLTVMVVNNRGEKKPEGAAQGQGAGASEKDDLLASLPHLDTDAAENKPLSMFKMKVDRVLPNGDLQLSFHRFSENGFETHDLKIMAKVPHSATMPGKQVTTADLYEIVWNEVEPYETINRQSFYWEDEYTLRLSGFDEAKSKIAAKLEEDKKQLLKVRNELQNKIKAFNQEKKTVVAEREKLASDRVTMEEKEKELSAKVDELTKQVEEQKEAIAESEKVKQDEEQKSASN